MFDRGSPWDGQYHGRSPQEPSQRYLRGTRLMCLRDPVQHVADDFAYPQREPGNKGNSIALTIIHQVIPFAVRKAIAVLHGDDWHNSPCSFDMLLHDVGQRDQTNLTFVSQLRQGFHRDFKRDDRVRNMQLIYRSEEHTSELQSHLNLVCRLLLEKK